MMRTFNSPHLGMGLQLWAAMPSLIFLLSIVYLCVRVRTYARRCVYVEATGQPQVPSTSLRHGFIIDLEVTDYDRPFVLQATVFLCLLTSGIASAYFYAQHSYMDSSNIRLRSHACRARTLLLELLLHPLKKNVGVCLYACSLRHVTWGSERTVCESHCFPAICTGTQIQVVRLSGRGIFIH